MRERGGGGLILRDPLPKRLKLSNRSTIGDGNRNHYMFMGRNAIQLLKSSSFWRLLHGMEQFVSSNIKWKKLNVKQCVQVNTNSVKEGQQPEHLFYVNLPPPTHTFILQNFFYNGSVSFTSRKIFMALDPYRQQTLLSTVVKQR